MHYFTFNCQIEANIWDPYCVCENRLTFRDFYGIFATTNYFKSQTAMWHDLLLRYLTGLFRFRCFWIKIYSDLKTIQMACLFSWNLSSWSQLIHLNQIFAMHRGKAAVEALSPWRDVAGKFWFNHVGANHGFSAVIPIVPKSRNIIKFRN